MRAASLALLLTTSLLGPVSAHAGREPARPIQVRIQDQTRDFALLREARVDVDGVFPGWVRVFADPPQQERLEAMGLEIRVLDNQAPARAAALRERAPTLGELRPHGLGDPTPTDYHTYETLTEHLELLASTYPGLVRLVSLGQSVEGRELWALKVTDRPDEEELEPGLAFIAGIHGDEVVGKELVVSFLDWILAGYGTDPRHTRLIDESELWVLPSFNPDGTEAGRRRTAGNVDLNRDFPDQFTDPNDSPDGRAPETQAIMSWFDAESIVLSAVFHGGALVASLPFDGNAGRGNVYSPSPDDAIFLDLARAYVDAHASMGSSLDSSAFDDGVTNGADWYVLNGGLQDWAYLWRGQFDITLEVSRVKWPEPETLPGFWNDNRDAMLALLERGLRGLRGVVTSEISGEPLAATVRVAGTQAPSFTDVGLGDYHRPLRPGRYDLLVEAPGHQPTVIEDVVVPATGFATVDVVLPRISPELRLESIVVDDGPGGDGIADPGETVALELTFEVLSANLSTPMGRLVGLDWVGEVTGDAVPYSDASIGEFTRSQAPHHVVTIPTDAPTDFLLSLALDWEEERLSDRTDVFTLPLSSPTCVVSSSGVLDLAVADHDQVTGSLTVEGPELLIEDARVGVEVTHPRTSDLRVELASPSGRPVLLHDRSPLTGTDLSERYGDTTPSFESLNRLNAEASTGDWTLSVRDTTGDEQGVLDSFEVELCGRQPDGLLPELPFRSVTRETDDSVRLQWWTYPRYSSYRLFRTTDVRDFGSYVELDPTEADVLVDDFDADAVFWLVRGEGELGVGPLGHYGQ
ncbi:MAG: M14 family zinc carboxypeptidase [Acidobacteriota bacterium]